MRKRRYRKMEGKILKISSMVLMITIVLSAGVLWQFSDVHRIELKQRQMSGLQMLAYYTRPTEQTEDISFKHQLQLELPQGLELDRVLFENDYVTQNIVIEIPGVEKDYFFKHPLLGRCNHINDLYMENGRIEISMDAVYEVETRISNGRLYLDFIHPRERYEKVVVIDPGHGGGAPGAIKQGIMEKDINLGIVKELKKLLDENDREIGVYYTRTEDVNPTFAQRAQLGEKAGANLFISVHCNSDSDAELSDRDGVEVLYDEQKSDEDYGGGRLAQICLEEFAAATGSKANGVANGSGIYILRNSEVPAALIEVGFMTNQEELQRMTTGEFQERAAQGIYQAILRALEER